MIQISTLTHLNCSFIKSDTDRVKDPQKKEKKKSGANKYLPISPRENALGNLFSGKPVQCSRISNAYKEKDGLCDPTQTIHHPSKTFSDSVVD